MTSSNLTPEVEAVFRKISTKLAAGKVPTKTIESLSKEIHSSKSEVIGIDICQMGICIDVELEQSIDEIDLKNVLKPFSGEIQNIEIFPLGITLPERLRVRITKSIENL
ncbi:hypothetical protein [Sphingorhabdus sp. Alg231-15]|uniref:hypothetical protein n=1 Tax=Sphingorhabdus sp. Alg231-15 TaxID=1922222 RepID=UPI000D55ED8B